MYATIYTVNTIFHDDYHIVAQHLPLSPTPLFLHFFSLYKNSTHLKILGFGEI